jgi:hypothetical protein
VPKNCLVIKTEEELSATMAPDVECAIIAAFKAPADRGLNAMREKVGKPVIGGGGAAGTAPWFADRAKMGNLQQTFALFHEFATANAGTTRAIKFAFLDVQSFDDYMCGTLGIDIAASGLLMSSLAAHSTAFVPPSAPRALRAAEDTGPLGLRIVWDDPERMPSSTPPAAPPVGGGGGAAAAPQITPLDLTGYEIEYTWEGNVEGPKTAQAARDEGGWHAAFDGLARVEHTFKVRATCKAGVSKWSDELKATPGIAKMWNSIGRLHDFVLEDMEREYPHTHFE